MTRFRRTKDELGRGLTSAQAQAEREAWLEKNPEALASVKRGLEDAKAGKFSDGPLKKNKGGEILLRIVPAKGVDPDYFEHLTGKTIEVTQNEHFYKWIDHLASGVYNEHGQGKLFEDVLTEGIGEVLTTRQFTKDIE